MGYASDFTGINNQIANLGKQYEDRHKIIGAIKIVDASIIQPEYDPSEILLNLKKVDVLVKGDDWEYIPGQETIEKLGGKLVKPGYTEGYSTSSLVKKMGKK